MKRFISRFFVLCFCAVMVLGALTATGSAKTVESGSCGKDATWVLDDKGVVTISGTGSMWYLEGMSNYELVKKIIIKDGITELGGEFGEFPNLKSVVIADSVTDLNTYTFARCHKLTSITIPKGVTRIGYGLFEDCSSLTSVTISGSVTVIDVHAFYGCTSLTTINLGDDLKSIGDYAFWGCSSLESIHISNRVMSIGDGAFTGCRNLKSAGPASGVTYIGEEAFKNCVSLKDFTLASGVTRIGAYAFENCNSLEHVTIPGSVTELAAGVFKRCEGLRSLTIKSGVQSVDDAAFYGCKSLKKVVIEEGLTDFWGYTFYGCSSLTDVTLPNTLGLIGHNTFENCTSLEHITLPDSVKRVANGLFKGCTNLKSVTLGKQSNFIFDGAFVDCSSLQSITIPASVTEIGDLVFMRCSSLKKITFLGDAPQFGYEIFSDVVAKAYYPANNPTWTNAVRKNHGGTIFWYPIDNTPEAPTIKVSNAASTGEIKLTWEKTNNTAKYEVYRASPEMGDYYYSKIATTANTSFVDKDTIVGNSYSYKIKAVNADGFESEFSNTVSRIRDLPRPEVSIANVASSGKIKLTWKQIEGAAKYEVYRATSKTGTYSKLYTTTGTSMTNTSAETGKIYYYKVRAVNSNSAANSAYSSVVSRTCDLPQPKVSIANVASSGKIKLTWEKIDGATKYAVYRATSKDGTYTRLGFASGTSYTNNSAKAGTQYYYKVRAVHSNSAANSADSSVVTRTCDLAQPKVSVTNVASTGKIKLTWEKIEGATKYAVYRATSKDGTYTRLGTTTNTSYTNSSAKAGTQYYYKVRALHTNSAANSADSSVVTRTCDLPQPKLTLKLSSKGKPEMSWNAVEGAVKYQIYRSTDKENWVLLKTTTNTSHTNGTAVAGTTYYYKVRAVHENSAANSAYSEIKYIKVK